MSGFRERQEVQRGEDSTREHFSGCLSQKQRPRNQRKQILHTWPSMFLILHMTQRVCDSARDPAHICDSARMIQGLPDSARDPALV